MKKKLFYLSLFVALILGSCGSDDKDETGGEDSQEESNSDNTSEPEEDIGEPSNGLASELVQGKWRVAGLDAVGVSEQDLQEMRQYLVGHRIEYYNPDGTFYLSLPGFEPVGGQYAVRNGWLVRTFLDQSMDSLQIMDAESGRMILQLVETTYDETTNEPVEVEYTYAMQLESNDISPDLAEPTIVDTIQVDADS